MPFGLSGHAVLPKSSCQLCARIIGQVEPDLLRGPMQPVRVYRQLKSRSRHRDAPSTYPITLIIDGDKRIVELPIHEYPILLHFPVFAPPACLSPDSRNSRSFEPTSVLTAFLSSYFRRKCRKFLLWCPEREAPGIAAGTSPGSEVPPSGVTTISMWSWISSAATGCPLGAVGSLQSKNRKPWQGRSSVRVAASSRSGEDNSPCMLTAPRGHPRR